MKLKNLTIEGPRKRPILLDVDYLPNHRAKQVVIFAHGFKGFKDWGTFPLVAKQLAEAGFICIRFNFSHNGGTAEQPWDFPDLEAFGQNNYSLEQADLKKVVSWVRQTHEIPDREIDRSSVSLIGHSRGGGAVLLYAGHNPHIHKVVTWAAVSDFGARFKAYPVEQWKKDRVIYIRNGRTLQDMPLYFQFYEDFTAHEKQLTISGALEKMTCPLLVIHGTKDEAVKVEEAQAILKNYPKAQQLLIEGAGHTFDGKHPWEQETLPPALHQALEASIAFLKR